MSNLTKVGVATVGIGTASGAGIAGYLHFSKDDFSNKSQELALDNSNNYEAHLKKQGRSLLPQLSTHWKTLVSKYSSEGDGLLISINGQTIQKNNLQEEQLKSWCSENSSKQFTSAKDDNYQRVSAWCTEPKTIKDLIGKDKVALNDSDPTGTTGGEDEWTEKVNKYKDSQNKDLIKEITQDREGNDIAVQNFNDAGKLRAWCRFSKTKHFKHEEDERYLKYIKWCTK
ncbi:hypothetical protein A6V39_00680 [Candidatus Mycoplasma haematobovis]|uniref:Uncharacterized protein n=1 Tax=Candidatus Mycoplasma haematobovis TaxID=432608 RepID=A0A1A9QF39_9MOLU|nr:hypothetical protein [Candidatus Mycoplasma haematobovis]OAL10566.1 hypothetical protein A6V39_00680 [Candidatus Mycoplasma haematobovis]